MKIKTKEKVQSPRSTVQTREVKAELPAGRQQHVDGEFKLVPRAAVRPDPNQPRKDFNEEKLKELAQSIAAQGILQPILVRFMPATVKIEEPNLIHDDWQAVDAAGAVVAAGKEELVRKLVADEVEPFYQIVDGERRWRAADLSGLNTVPIVIREMDERQVFNAQWTSNQARENLSALEEGVAFAKQIEARRVVQPEFSQKELAVELGVATGTISTRMALTRLTPAVHAALVAGKIQTTVAGAIAQLPDPKRQEHLLKKITNEDDWNFPFSYREVEDLVEAEYCQPLKDAPFDLDTDFTSDKGARLGTCTECIHRSGNMVEAFPQIKNFKLCTKTDCFAQKCKIHFADAAAAAERAGQTVMTEKEFKKVKGDYSKGTDYSYANDRYYDSWETVLGKKLPTPVMVVTAAGLEKFYTKTDLVTAAKEKGVKMSEDARSQTAEENAKFEEKRIAEEARRVRRSQLVIDSAPTLLKCLGKLSDKLAWELVAEMIPHIKWTNENLENCLMLKTNGHKAAVLARCFADIEYYPVTNTGDWDKPAVELWKNTGVDLVALDKKLEKEGAPALPLAKAEAKQKELLAVKKNRKKK